MTKISDGVYSYRGYTLRKEVIMNFRPRRDEKRLVIWTCDQFQLRDGVRTMEEAQSEIDKRIERREEQKTVRAKAMAHVASRERELVRSLH